MKNRRLTSTLLCIVFIAICIFQYLGYQIAQTAKYKEEYFSDKESYVKISEIVIDYYKSNAIQGEMSIWFSEKGMSVFYNDSLYDESEPNIVKPLVQSEIEYIDAFINGSRFEYVAIDEKFVEFGNSTGSMFIYLCLTNQKPKKLSSLHTMNDFGEGWYFSKSTAH